MDSMAQQGRPRVGSLEADQIQPYAPYGKACLNCAKSKTRCAAATTGGSPGKCERCHRLNKDCQPAPTVRKRRVSKRPTSPTSRKTAALEAKLDGLVQMLERSQNSIPGMSQSEGQVQNQSIHSGAQTLSPSGCSDADETSQSVENVRDHVRHGVFFAANTLCSISSERLGGTALQNGPTRRSEAGNQGFIRGPPNGPPTPATSTACNSSVPDGPNNFTSYPLETEAELEDYLETFRTKMVPYFPIVCVGANTTVEELRRERPFLFLVIRAICSKNLERQAALVMQIKKGLGEEMLIEGTRNQGLFLGVLVFAGWCHVYICKKPIISTIIQLAMSLAFDLGLTRPLPREPVHVMLNYTAQGCPRLSNGLNIGRTMEDRRAVVGLYLASSVVANYFQRIELMRWSRYLDECLHLLDEKKEYPTDELLVYLVRVQLICNKGGALTLNDIFGDTEMRAPVDFYAKTMKSQLDDLERSIPQDLKSNVTLKLHILNTTITIHEYSLTTVPKSTSVDPAEKFQQIESLWICFTAVKSWFNTFLSLETFPLSCYTHFSMIVLTQMAHCLVALFRLSTFESPDIPWDRQRVRQELDFGDVITLVMDRYQQVPPAVGIELPPWDPQFVEREYGQWPEGSWLQAMNNLLHLKRVWEAKIAALAAVDAEREAGQGLGDNGVVSGFGVPGEQQMDAFEFGAMNMDILDETWIRDILGGGFDYNL